VVREDSLTLFGFADDDERALFETLQSATGVGPRLAQAALAVLSPDELRRAVATEDLATLCRVPGIGRKGAQRIVVELKDRLGPVPAGAAPAAVPPSDVTAQVIQALQSLGWGPREAEPAATAAVVTAGADADVATVLKVALRGLQRA
jgi:Holliday junction DNA helicase RuvA